MLGPKDSEPIDDQGKKIESDLEAVWLDLIEDEQRCKVLAEAGFENPDRVTHLVYYHQVGEILQHLHGSRKTLDINGVFQVKNCGRLLFSDEPCQSRLTTLPQSEQGSNRVYLKRSLI